MHLYALSNDRLLIINVNVHSSRRE